MVNHVKSLFAQDLKLLIYLVFVDSVCLTQDLVYQIERSALLTNAKVIKS